MSPASDKSWERAVKRHAKGGTFPFTALVNPGFEAEGQAELGALGIEVATLAPGHLHWEGSLDQAYAAALRVRTVNRLRLVLARFHAGAREELFRRAHDLPWELWFPRGTEARVRAQVELSRIRHEGWAAETLARALERRLGDQGQAFGSVPEPEDCQVLLRLVENRAEISLDLSGALHYRRGYRLEQNRAPLRESLAAALVLRALGASGSIERVHDAFSGSGTLAIEAAAILAGAPAGSGRTFACDRWPGLGEAQRAWHRRKAAEEGEVPRAEWSVSASELDPAVADLARRNLGRASAFPGWAGLQGRVEVSAADFFSVEPWGRGLLLMNPPYGLRLDDGTNALYRRIGESLRGPWSAWDAMVLVPESVPGKLLPPASEVQAFRHGGLLVRALFYCRGAV